MWPVALLIALLTGCSGQPDGTGLATDRVVVFMAASTNDAVREIAEAFMKQTGGKIDIDADDSSKLAMQVDHGAPADLFLSANEKWADFVKGKGLAQEDKVLLGNSLVIVVPRGNPAMIKRPKDLLKGAVRRVAIAGPTVPAGMYGRQALKKLKLWDALERDRKIIPGENVRAALAFVQRGEAEAGIVYATDARTTEEVEQVFVFDASEHEPIRYPLLLLKEGRTKQSARAFYEFLQSPAAAAVFEKHGFTVLGRK
jgi:molybdate transport system substrate-binding protein